MKIRAVCPEHGEWYPDLKDRKSRSRCRIPGCEFRYVPKAADFRHPEAEPAPEPESEPDNGARLAAVDAAIVPLHPALRSMIRLMLSSAAARYHLRQARPRGHLSGIAAGPTQRGKTLVAVIACKALGVDEVAGIRQAAKETELSLWRTAGGLIGDEKGPREAVLRRVPGTPEEDHRHAHGQRCCKSRRGADLRASRQRPSRDAAR